MKYLRILPFCVSLFLLVGAPATANTQRIEATYDFVWNGMLVSTAETVTELGEYAYSLTAEMRMRGMAKLFVGGGKTIFSASGRVGKDGVLHPREYENTGNWKGNPYRESIRYDGTGNLENLVNEWPQAWRDKNPREEVPAGLQSGHDPAALLVELMRHPLALENRTENAAPFVFKVFDGDTVVNWSIDCSATPVFLEKSKHSAKSASAHECSLSQHLIAGQRILTEKQKSNAKKKKRTRRPVKGRRRQKKTYDGPLKVWMQPVVGASHYWMPVQALVPSPKGIVHVYLKNLVMAEANSFKDAKQITSR